MTRIVSIAACLALTGALLAGCGGSSSKSTSSNGGGASTSGTATATVGGGAAAGAGEVKVAMKNIKFVPANITAKVGQTIKWTNTDPFPHTVKATSGATFSSPNIDANGTYTFKVTKPGTINYFCTIHGPQQSGTITVTG